jgi:hypothetical protein
MSESRPRRVACEAIDVRDIVGDLGVVAWHVNVQGELLLLAVEAGEVITFQAHRGNLPPGYAFRTVRAPCATTLFRIGDDRVQRVQVPRLPIRNFRIETLPGDETLVAEVLANPKSGRPNAFVCGPAGDLRRSFPLGRGFEEMQTTADGRIWVSYEDEGVHGNVGWENAPWVERAANAHLACFSSRGELVYAYRRPPGFKATPGYVTHLNVDCRDVWFVDAADDDPVFGNSPLLVRLDPAGCESGIDGVLACGGATAVGRERVLQWSYHFDLGSVTRTQFFLFHDRTGDGAAAAEEIEWVGPEGRVVASPTVEGMVVARGSRLHYFHGSEGIWYRCDADTLEFMAGE